MNKEVVLTYLSALIQSTEKKGKIIEQLLLISRKQEEVSKNPEFNLDEYLGLLDEKQPWIDELAKIDDGFSQTFERIQDHIKSEKHLYVTQLQQLQALIASVTTKAVELQAIEKRNKSFVDRRIMDGRQKVKSHTVSNKVVSNYYKNMANQHYNQSYFLDRKK